DLREIVAELGRSTDTFGRFVRQQAERIPDRIALKFEAEQVTYGAYDREVNRLAAALARAGGTAGSPIALLCLNSPLFLFGLGAVAKLGAIGALLNTHVSGAGLTHVLRASGARIGLCDAHALPTLAEVAGSHGVSFLADGTAASALPPDVRALDDLRPHLAPEP